MKLLFDQNISFRLIAKIALLFPGSKHVNEIELYNATDREIWEYAKSNNFMIVTFDVDFYDFSLVWGHPPKIIWIRSDNQTTSEIEKILKGHSDTIIKFHSDQSLACLEIINHNR